MAPWATRATSRISARAGPPPGAPARRRATTAMTVRARKHLDGGPVELGDVVQGEAEAAGLGSPPCGPVEVTTVPRTRRPRSAATRTIRSGAATGGDQGHGRPCGRRPAGPPGTVLVGDGRPGGGGPRRRPGRPWRAGSGRVTSCGASLSWTVIPPRTISATTPTTRPSDSRSGPGAGGPGAGRRRRPARRRR